METHVVIGIALIAAALGEVVSALVVVPRVENPGKRGVLLMALGSSALVMLGLGVAFAAGLIPLQ